jgi:hypothetical protein
MALREGFRNTHLRFVKDRAVSVVILIKPIDTKTKNGTPARVAGIGMIGGDLLD